MGEYLQTQEGAIRADVDCPEVCYVRGSQGLFFGVFDEGRWVDREFLEKIKLDAH